jgi:hypothetical protein
MEKKNVVPVVLPIRDVDVVRDAADSSGAPVMLRVFRDHEAGVPPMWFVDFITHDQDQRPKRALIPIIDVDGPRLAEAIMRLQAEHAAMAAAWHTARAAHDRPEAAPELPALPALIISK